MTPEEKAALKTSFKEVVDESLQPIKDEIKLVKESSEKEMKELTAKVGKLEAVPAGKRPISGIDFNKTLYGRKISKMGAQWRSPDMGGKSLRQIIADDPSRFDSFSNEESFEKYCEFMVNFVEARVKRNPDAMQKLHEIRKAAYAEGAAGTGGDLVPTEYEWDIIQLARNRTMGLNECTVLPMSEMTLQVPKEATLVSVAWTAEAIAATAGEGTVDHVTLTAKKLAALATVSNELIGDSQLDIVGLLTQQFSYAVLLELDNQILAGTGSPVSGLMKGTSGTSIVLGTGSAAFSMIKADNLSDAISRLPDGYLDGAKFVFHRTTKHFLRILKDSNGGYIFQPPSQGAGLPGTVFEYPYIISEVCPTTAISTVQVLFGNLKYFMIGRRLGSLTLDVDPYGKFAEYSTRFRIITRWGLGLGLAAPFVTVVTSAT